jgi:hypothetical protein
VAVFVVALAVRGWFGLPDAARVSPRQLSTREPRVVVGGALLGVSVLSLLVWTVLVALGSAASAFLVAALVFSAVAVANSSFGLSRIWHASR